MKSEVDQVIGHPSNGGGGNTRSKRSRRNKNKQHHQKESTSYRNISFHERPSSGRPGSPHRYFDNSYDVLFNGGGDDGDDDSSPLKEPKLILGEQPNPQLKTPQPVGDGTMDTNDNLRGNQVVHRHLNGLCIVTAGNVLEQVIESKGITEVGISSIQYLVKVGKDSQSARGKLRTKNKKQKRVVEKGDTPKRNAAVEDHDGNVLPHDPLCRITFSDGKEFLLNCCVEGTIIELNNQLHSGSGGLTHNEGEMNTDAVNKAEAVTKKVLNQSILLNDPLLGGHLAVIMPTKGAFPPKEK